MSSVVPSYRSICILRLSAIGDVCHAVASVQAIQQYYPDAKITWVIGQVEAMLIGDLPNVKFIIFNKKQGLAAYKKLRRDLPETFDVLLHMQVALRANLAAMVIKAKQKIGFNNALSKELHSLAVNKTIKPVVQPHVYDGFKAFTAAIGVPDFQPKWQIPISQADKTWAAEQKSPDKPLFVIAAAASKAERNWLPERYAELADHAVKQGFNVILSGGPTTMETSLATAIIKNCQVPVTNLVGQTTLKQLLALLGEADLVLAPDTGPAHMAVTQQTPVIGLYAHSNPARTGPYLYLDYVVEVYHQMLQAQFAVSAAQAKWGKRVKGENLMQAISVDRVIKMFDRVVQENNLK
ncbi:glycosyltransferase family 9 protein [Algibacillus agarilyticus]|uniref:glycosyltransferase family 9 protein n=1 Tax=Algibacillus agarilyticus TaxID=2234133 RepID=UPI000DD0E5B2|nr:glycosyltransferase family 9 protein [Algibacillus agarilyticus]